MATTEGRRGALVFIGTLIIGSLAASLFWPLPAARSWIVGVAAHAVLFTVLLVSDPRRERLANHIILAGVVIAGVQIWISNDLAMRSSSFFRPFEGYKLVALGLALVAPAPLWVGLVGIGAMAIVPIVETFHWPLAIRAELPAPEPWITVLYGVVASILLIHRRRQLAAQVAVVRLQSKATYAEQLMRKFQAVRDLANSPLQAIEATLTLLRRKHPESKTQLVRIERQLDRLHKLTTVLSRYDRTRTSAADERSFNALEVLQRVEDSSTKEFDNLFLVAPENGRAPGPRDGEQEKLDEVLRFTSFGLENSPICAFWMDLDGRVVYVNQASCVSLGYSRSELLGMHVSTFAPRVSREHWRPLVDGIRRERPRPYLSVHRRKDGTLVPVSINVLYAELNGRGFLLGFARELEAQAQPRDEDEPALPGRIAPQQTSRDLSAPR
jgi:PAS domain S-box-containing protein